MLQKIPTDILREIFQFLCRNEIEKSQLVSKQWNFHIKNYSGLLPLRLLNELKIKCDDENQPYFKLDGLKGVKTLESCILQSLVFEEKKYSLDDKGVEVLHSLQEKSSNFDRILSIASPPKKIFLKINDGYFQGSDASTQFFHKLNGDSRFRLIFGSYESTYLKQFCLEMINLYTNFKEPEKLIKIVKFVNFVANVPKNTHPGNGHYFRVGHKLFMHWVSTRAKKQSQKDVIINGNIYRKFVYEIEPELKDRLVEIVFISRTVQEILTMKIKLSVYHD